MAKPVEKQGKKAVKYANLLRLRDFLEDWFSDWFSKTKNSPSCTRQDGLKCLILLGFQTELDTE